MLAALGGLMEAARVSSVTGSQGYGEGIIFSVLSAGDTMSTILGFDTYDVRSRRRWTSTVPMR